VEFKDWQTVLLFFEQTITNYWKKNALQSPKGETMRPQCPLLMAL